MIPSERELVEKRERQIEDWLHDHAPNVFADQKHLDDESTERAYWHYGYLAALRDVLKLRAWPTIWN